MPAGTFLTLLVVINQTARLVGSAKPSTGLTE